MPENLSATILSNAENRRTPAFPQAGLWPYPNDINQDTLSEIGLVVVNASQTFKRKIIDENIAHFSRDFRKHEVNTKKPLVSRTLAPVVLHPLQDGVANLGFTF